LFQGDRTELAEGISFILPWNHGKAASPPVDERCQLLKRARHRETF
jgi:hypothetical protein